MDPFPHDAPKSIISDNNPAGTDGFEFVEFSHAEPDQLRELFGKMGYIHTATHKSKDIQLWQQGDITYIINNEPGSHARRKGNMEVWFEFYRDLFGFKEIRFFDIQGKFTGLRMAIIFNLSEFTNQPNISALMIIIHRTCDGHSYWLYRTGCADVACCRSRHRRMF